MDKTKACRDIEELIPEVQKGALLFLEECKRQGLNVLITETYRSQERQDYLYEQGRSRPGRKVTWTRRSKHTSRRAFDICRKEKGREYDNSDGFFKKAADIAVSLGFTAGYYWSKQDMPHIQLDEGKHIKAKEKKEYMKEKVKIELEGKEIEAVVINDGGHRYMLIQDLWKFGFKVSGNDKEITIEKGEA